MVHIEWAGWSEAWQAHAFWDGFSIGVPQNQNNQLWYPRRGDPPHSDDSVTFLDELMALSLLFKISFNFICPKSSLSGKLLIPPSFLVPCKAVNSLITSGLLFKLRVWQISESASYLTVGAQPWWFSVFFQIIHLTFLRLSVHCLPEWCCKRSLLWVGRRLRFSFSSGHQWVVAQLYLNRVDFRDLDPHHLP